MDPRPPFPYCRSDPGFGPFDASANGRGRDRGPATLRRAIAAAGGEVADAPREIDSFAMIAENNRRAAGETFSCVACQIAIVLAACVSLGLAAMIGWHQMIIYEAQLAACAGV